MVVESKQKLKAEVEDLKNLKEEFSEYKEVMIVNPVLQKIVC